MIHEIFTKYRLPSLWIIWFITKWKEHIRTFSLKIEYLGIKLNKSYRSLSTRQKTGSTTFEHSATRKKAAKAFILPRLLINLYLLSLTTFWRPEIFEIFAVGSLSFLRNEDVMVDFARGIITWLSFGGAPETRARLRDFFLARLSGARAPEDSRHPGGLFLPRGKN